MLIPNGAVNHASDSRSSSGRDNAVSHHDYTQPPLCGASKYRNAISTRKQSCGLHGNGSPEKSLRGRLEQILIVQIALRSQRKSPMQKKLLKTKCGAVIVLLLPPTLTKAMAFG